MTSSWKRKKDKIRRKFQGLASEDLVYKIGNEAEMIKRLKAKLEKSTKELLSIFIEF